MCMPHYLILSFTFSYANTDNIHQLLHSSVYYFQQTEAPCVYYSKENILRVLSIRFFGRH